MTAVETPAASITHQHLALLYQYTVEAYKAFQKLAESVPNPMTANMFKQFATDERENRDLLEMKAAAISGNRSRVTLGSDLIFSQILERELSPRESAEFLISRERTMQRKLRELITAAAPSDLALLLFVETVKRAHAVELERELELLRHDSDWWKHEDAEWRIVHGAAS
jgi:rubrerythrin